MSSAARARTSTRRSVAAAIAGLAFVLELVCVPLHLAWNDHVLAVASEAHVRAHAALVHQYAGRRRHDDGHRHDGDDHRHHGGPSQADAPASEHEPHPVADHLEQVEEPAVPPTFEHVGLALVPRAVVIVPLDAPVSLRPDEPEARPRPPPLREAARPRAPPIVA